MIEKSAPPPNSLAIYNTPLSGDDQTALVDDLEQFDYDEVAIDINIVDRMIEYNLDEIAKYLKTCTVLCERNIVILLNCISILS